MAKSADAFRTISEVAELLQVPAHVLRFWESRFAQVKPVKRAGGRRYYRPADIRLLAGIRLLLHDEGMTIKGVQKILREQGVQHVATLAPALAEINADDASAPAGAEVLSFAPRPGAADTGDADADLTDTEDRDPGDTDPYVVAPDDPEPHAPAARDPLPGDDSVPPRPVPSRQEAPGAAPPASHDRAEYVAEPPSEPAPQAGTKLPPLPDLPADPPDTVAATPGALATLAGLQRPVTADLSARLQALEERLRGPAAQDRANDRAGD